MLEREDILIFRTHSISTMEPLLLKFDYHLSIILSYIKFHHGLELSMHLELDNTKWQ